MKKISLIIFILICSVFYGCNNKNMQKVSLYYSNPTYDRLVEEKRNVDVSAGNVAESVLKALLAGPKDSAKNSVIPEGTKLLSANQDGTLVTVNLSSYYNKVSTPVQSMLSRFSIVCTLTDIEGISRVLIQTEGQNITSPVTGEQIGALSRNDVVLDQGTTAPAETANVTLYFSNSNAYLDPEKRTVTIKENDSIEKAIVAEIIKGPKVKTLSRTIPAETKILHVETKDKVCYLNLSRDFMDKTGNSSAEQMLSLYSIVNSLTELRTIESVQFLIEGEKVNLFKEMIFNEPFKRNSTMFQPK